MKLPFSFFLALKYLRPKRSFVSIITMISVIGVSLGVAVLFVVISVMNGFDEIWTKKILSFNAHITVQRPGEPIQRYRTIVDKVEAVSQVNGASPFVRGVVLVSKDDRVFTPILKGVHPHKEREVSKVPDNIVRGSYRVGPDQMVVGDDLATRLGVGVGDQLLVHSSRSLTSSNEFFLPEEFDVSGIFDIGMYDVDVGFVFAGLPDARQLFGMDRGVDGLTVMTEDPFRALETARRIEEALPARYTAQTWMERNSQLFGALQVEKNMMFFLLIMITVVAGFGIMNTLITLTVQKTREIGVLKAIGSPSGQILRVFAWLGLIQGIIGNLLGFGLGALLLHYRNDLMDFLNRRLNVELLPEELYQLSRIPAVVESGDVWRIASAVLVICILAGLVPAYRAARLDPAQALRNE